MIILKDITRFDMNTEFILCHGFSTLARKQKSTKFSVDGTQTNEF